LPLSIVLYFDCWRGKFSILFFHSVVPFCCSLSYFVFVNIVSPFFMFYFVFIDCCPSPCHFGTCWTCSWASLFVGSLTGETPAHDNGSGIELVSYFLLLVLVNRNWRLCTQLAFCCCWFILLAILRCGRKCSSPTYCPCCTIHVYDVAWSADFIF
jgi:hypothetical protein